MFRNLFLCLFIISFTSFIKAEDLPLGKLIHDGPATPEQISLYR